MTICSAREWNNRLEDTSEKVHTYQHVYLQKHPPTRTSQDDTVVRLKSRPQQKN